MTYTTSSSIVERIDDRVARQHLLQHPFYQAWSRGELTMDALRDYATQYYHHVAAFPTYLSAVHAQTDNAEVRRHILSNLMDEEAGSPNHPELWLEFAESLGLERHEVKNSTQWDATKNLIATFRNCCGQRGTSAGLASLYAYESQIPAVSEKKIGDDAYFSPLVDMTKGKNNAALAAFMSLTEYSAGAFTRSVRYFSYGVWSGRASISLILAIR